MVILDCSLDTMHHVADFYQQAWDKLIGVIGIVFACIGIIIPLLLQYIQKQTFKEERENYRLELKVETDEKFKGLEKRIEEFMKALTEEKEVLQVEHEK